MKELELFISEQIKLLIPHYEAIELKAMVSSSSYSIEFFATIQGNKMQCFDMIDKGMFSEKKFNLVSKAIATYVRETPGFNKEGINKFSVAF